MELISIISTISLILLGFVLIALGVLIVRHKSALNYFKKSSNEEIDGLDEVEDTRQGLLPNAMAVLSDSFNLLVAGKQSGSPTDAQDEGTNKTVVLIGQSLIVIGYITILTAVISVLMMFSMRSRINF